VEIRVEKEFVSNSCGKIRGSFVAIRVENNTCPIRVEKQEEKKPLRR